MFADRRVLILPGWQNSGPGHWQSRWEALYGFVRVEQADWDWPRRGDWMARLDEVLLDGSQPALLVAHSLGCHLVAAWASHTQHTHRVQAALLVAPPDIERDDMPPQVSTWRPIARQRLPFPATLLYSDDDPYCAPTRAVAMAADWGAAPVSLGATGHVNGDSALGDWPAGLAHLDRLAASASVGRAGRPDADSRRAGPGA
jgi:predicted alpha/beta hydrolase family esterase